MSESEAAAPSAAVLPRERRSSPLTALVRSMRPRQWTKNALLFSGLFLNARFDRLDLWLYSAAGFVIFCLLSGSVYLINDIKDIESDRRHEKKRFRPIAAGMLSPQAAGIASGLLALLSLGWAALIGVEFWWCAAIYWVLVLSYSMGLKHQVILDVMALAGGFVLRALAGIYVIEPVWGEGHIPVTAWFLVCTMFLALFIALSKRRAEMVVSGHEAHTTRRVLRDYTVPLLDQLIAMAATLTVVTYALYCVQERQRLIITLPFVLFGVMRFLWHVYRNDEGGAPEILLYKDKALLLCVLLWVGTISIILYR